MGVTRISAAECGCYAIYDWLGILDVYVMFRSMRRTEEGAQDRNEKGSR